MTIKSESQLREIYGQPAGRTRLKQLEMLEKHSKSFIELAPFVAISTSNTQGKQDSSPRGGNPGFVKIIDDKTIIIPDAKGNKRLDSLVNIIETGQVGCLFMIPGVDETLRINGEALLSTKVEYLALFNQENNPPQCVIEITISEVFLHCAKALMRSKLWQQDFKIERCELPTMGRMINDQIGESSEPESHSAMVTRYQKDL